MKKLFISCLLLIMYGCYERKEKIIEEVVKNKIDYYRDFNIFEIKGTNKINNIGKTDSFIIVKNNYQEISFLMRKDTILNILKIYKNIYNGKLNDKFSVFLIFDKNIVKEIYYETATKKIHLYTEFINNTNFEIKTFFKPLKNIFLDKTKGYANINTDIFFTCLTESYYLEKDYRSQSFLSEQKMGDGVGVKMFRLGVTVPISASHFWGIYMLYRQKLIEFGYLEDKRE